MDMSSVLISSLGINSHRETRKETAFMACSIAFPGTTFKGNPPLSEKPGDLMSITY